MTKYCVKCKTSINLDKDHYVKFEEIKEKKQVSKLFYHRECFRDIMKGKVKADKSLEKANKIMSIAASRLGISEKDNKKEEYVLD